MPLQVGDRVDVTIEKPAAGGRMIARHEGQVIFVAGAIPGERVTIRVTRAEKQIAFADTVNVVEASSDRRNPGPDPLCGGCVYAHIEYARQIQLKAELIQDAFTRIGRIPVAESIPVTAGAERAYRMRARFRIRNGSVGFYRERTHDICDARQTRQLSEEAVDAVEAAVRALTANQLAATYAELSENIAADQRALYVETASSASLTTAVAAAVAQARLTGAIVTAADGATAVAGDPIVTDPLPALTNGRIRSGVLRRHPQSFFQANRYLIASLVVAVLDAVRAAPVVDLYAGVGLFSVSLAAGGLTGIIAVEGDHASGTDLQRNAAPYQKQLLVERGSVEQFVQNRAHQGAGTLIVDPPRTGMSRAAAEAIAHARIPRIIYVSCDAATMARDARRLLDADYQLTSLQGFDLFPNTPHVEALGIFDL